VFQRSDVKFSESYPGNFKMEEPNGYAWKRGIKKRITFEETLKEAQELG
jgi:hypothetical protein